MSARYITSFLLSAWIGVVVLGVVPHAHDAFAPFKDLSLVIGAGVMLALLLPGLLRQRPLPSPARLFWTIAVIAALAWLMPRDGVVGLSRHSLETYRLTALVAAACIVINTVSTIGKRSILGTWVVIGWTESLIVFSQFAGFDPFALLADPSGTWRVYGTMGNPNLVSALLVPILLLALDPEVIGSRRVRLTSAAVLSLAVVLCGSRFATAALAVALLAVCLPALRSMRRATVTLLVLALILVVTGAFIVAYVVMDKNFGSPWGRMFFWKAAAALVRERPLTGYGLGSFEANYPHGAGLVVSQEGAPVALPVHAHNDWIEFVVELGLFALIFPAGALWALFSSWRRPERRFVAAAFAVMVLTASWSAPLHFAPTALLFFTLFAILATGARRPRVEGYAWLVVVLLSCSLSLLGIRAMKERMTGHLKAGYARDAFARQDVGQAIELWREAKRLAPSEGEFSYWLARGLATQGYLGEAILVSDEAAKSYADFNLYILQARLYQVAGRQEKTDEIIAWLQKVFPELKVNKAMLDGRQ